MSLKIYSVATKYFLCCTDAYIVSNLIIFCFLYYSDCGNVTAIANAVIDFADVETTFGRTISVTCKTGYEIMGTGFIECQRDGSWSVTTTCETLGLKILYHRFVKFVDTIICENTF